MNYCNCGAELHPHEKKCEKCAEQDRQVEEMFSMVRAERKGKEFTPADRERAIQHMQRNHLRYNHN